MSRGSDQGIDTKSLKRVGVKTGAPRRGINPGAVGQIGMAVGKNPEQPEFERALPSQLGNAVAAATRCGPGGSRTVRASGTQGTHGPVDRGSHRPNASPNEWPDAKNKW
jgi:hypothetical protein